MLSSFVFYLEAVEICFAMGLGIYNSNPPVVVNDHILDSADLTGNVKDSGTRSVLVKFLGAHASQISKYYPAPGF
jgi:hypothetical protein